MVNTIDKHTSGRDDLIEVSSLYPMFSHLFPAGQQEFERFLTAHGAPCENNLVSDEQAFTVMCRLLLVAWQEGCIQPSSNAHPCVAQIMLQQTQARNKGVMHLAQQ